MDPRFRLVEHKVQIGGRDWIISAVENQDVLLEAIIDTTEIERFPYGMLLWPSAIALATWLCENSDKVRGKRILELGAGAGLPGIVARWLGAEVCQTDYQPDVLALAGLNAAANAVQRVEQRALDWRDPYRLPDSDLVIAADVLYERSLHASLEATLLRAVSMGGRAVIADPVRPHGIDFVDMIERSGWSVVMESRIVEWEEQPKEIALFTLIRP